jgi:hypothetical protein
MTFSLSSPSPTVKGPPNSTLRAFSVQKDPTFLQKEAWASRTISVLSECPELRSLQESYSVFSNMFTVFHRQNGPAITGAYLSTIFLRFKGSFELFLLHISHYFNSSVHFRRFSPLLQLAEKFLSEWAVLVTTVNQLSECTILPHLRQFQIDFEELSKQISTICTKNVTRSYYRDTLFVSSNALKLKVTVCYQRVYTVLSREHADGFSQSQLQFLRREILSLWRAIQEDFLELLASAVTTRRKTAINAACGDAM